jgi:hypothetical protein
VLEFHARDVLPPCVPMGERWTQCISNRTFKSKVVQLVIDRLTSEGSLSKLESGQSLVIDYQGSPIQYRKGEEAVELSQFGALGEADVKFARYADMFADGGLQVCIFVFALQALNLAAVFLFFILAGGFSGRR